MTTQKTKPISDDFVSGILNKLGVDKFVVTPDLNILKPESITGFDLFKRSLVLAYSSANENAKYMDHDELGMDLAIHVLGQLNGFEVDGKKHDASGKLTGVDKFRIALGIAVLTAEKDFKADSTPKLDDNQLHALIAYAANHGKQWKDQLSEAWRTGADEREADGHLLRQIRNQLGPQWLSKFDITEIASDGVAAHRHWESIRGKNDSELLSEVSISELAEKAGADMERWWASWLQRSDEWNKENPIHGSTKSNGKSI